MMKRNLQSAVFKVMIHVLRLSYQVNMERLQVQRSCHETRSCCVYPFPKISSINLRKTVWFQLSVYFSTTLSNKLFLFVSLAVLLLVHWLILRSHRPPFLVFSLIQLKWSWTRFLTKTQIYTTRCECADRLEHPKIQVLINYKKKLKFIMIWREAFKEVTFPNAGYKRGQCRLQEYKNVEPYLQFTSLYFMFSFT